MATTVTEEKVYEALRRVQDPELRHDIVELGFIQEIDIVGDYVHIDLQLTTPHCPFAETILTNVRDAVAAIPGVAKVEVERACLKGD